MCLLYWSSLNQSASNLMNAILNIKKQNSEFNKCKDSKFHRDYKVAKIT